MSTTSQLASDRSPAYIRGSTQSNDVAAQLHRRRKRTMIAILADFEALIEPLLPPGHSSEITEFKRTCRSKLNGLTFEAIELMRLRPGEKFNGAAADLAEQIEFDANGGMTK